ncbi:MAG: hypothetical protein V4519_02150 [Patescibacteria group bacterium]
MLDRELYNRGRIYACSDGRSMTAFYDHTEYPDEFSDDTPPADRYTFLHEVGGDTTQKVFDAAHKFADDRGNTLSTWNARGGGPDPGGT